MAHRVNLKLVTSDGVVHTCSTDFDESEWTLLNDFCTEARRLRESGAVRDGAIVRCRMSAGEAMETQGVGELSNRDQFEALLLRMRPFVLADEPTRYDKIHALLRRRIPLAPYHGFLDRIHRSFLVRSPPLQISIASPDDSVPPKTVFSETTFQQWLNAYQFHRDSAKKRALQPIVETLSVPGLDAQMFCILVDKVRAVLELDASVQRLLRRDGVESTMYGRGR